MKIDTKRLDFLKELFKNIPEVLAGYFYGSRASGYASLNSDLDLAVVVDNSAKINYGELYLKVNQILKDAEIDLRIITKQTSPTFIFQVIKTGQCIYQRSGVEKMQFEAKALGEYYDGEHIRNIYDSYLKSFFKD